MSHMKQCLTLLILRYHSDYQSIYESRPMLQVLENTWTQSIESLELRGISLWYRTTGENVTSECHGRTIYHMSFPYTEIVPYRIKILYTIKAHYKAYRGSPSYSSSWEQEVVIAPVSGRQNMSLNPIKPSNLRSWRPSVVISCSDNSFSDNFLHW